MTGSEIKSVKYNEDLFKIPSGTQKRKKANKPPIKIKPVTNKTIKNKILDEIRKNQEKQYKSLLEETPKSTTSLSDKGLFDNDFQKSVEYMQTFADKYKEETKLNKTIRNTQETTNVDHFATNNLATVGVNTNNTFSEIYSSPPQKFPNVSYGCLKNGNLPTYRNYCNRTVKNPVVSTTAPLVLTSTTTVQPAMQVASHLVTTPVTGSLVNNGGSGPPPDIQSPPQLKSIAERIKSPAELLLIEKVKQKAESTKPKPIHKKIKKIMRRTYRTGKDKYRPRVSVLLPNKTIRRNVITKSYLLKQTPIEEIRKTLLKQGFIKIGSSAPNDVLRKMYESIQMIGGDINNHNPDNLLYNFFNEKGKS
jgi:hypothetical protein